MNNVGQTNHAGSVEPIALETQVAQLAGDLATSFRRVFENIPGAPHKPSALSRTLGISRVTISKLRTAITVDDPAEMLRHIPGPESLRAIARAAEDAGVDPHVASKALASVDAFAKMIRQEFGTRSAFNAAITPVNQSSGARLELANRYQVSMGMRQILGVEADTWLTSMIFSPCPEDPGMLSVTTIHGAIGMRRLRPDADVYFTFGPPHARSIDAFDPSPFPVDLREFCTHEPAPLESSVLAGQLVHRLAHDKLGRKATVDMLAVSHNARGSRRYATPERPRGGLIVFPDVPVKTLICDALLHEDAFPNASPNLMVYNPGGRGPANPADPLRDIDKVDIPERIEHLSQSPSRFTLPEVPRYIDMLDRVGQRIDIDPRRLRVFRLRMAYPVHGFQIVMAFDAPQKP